MPTAGPGRSWPSWWRFSAPCPSRPVARSPLTEARSSSTGRTGQLRSAFRPHLATRAYRGQKGAVETTNRSMRRWRPRDIDPTSISGPQLKTICERLNAMPRKCLGWRTPSEVFREKVLERRASPPMMTSARTSRLTCRSPSASQHGARCSGPVDRAVLHLDQSAGSTTMKQLPWPISLSIRRRPRWRFTMCFTMARPRPVPPTSRDRWASTR